MKKLLQITFIGLLFVNCKSDLKPEINVVGKKIETSQKDEKYKNGRALFLINCASCHSTQMDKIMTV